jgi:DNA-directed RNA polymerase specialized sigma24 family protein
MAVRRLLLCCLIASDIVLRNVEESVSSGEPTQLGAGASMEWTSPSIREAFWQDIGDRFEVRLRAYVRRTQCSTGEADELIADLWALAVEHEDALVGSVDPWLVLRPLLARLCAGNVRVWRHEVERDAFVDAAGDPSEHDRLGHLLALRSWWALASKSLSEQQRLAVDFRFRWEWSFLEVAGALGVTEATAGACASRAREVERPHQGESPTES